MGAGKKVLLALGVILLVLVGVGAAGWFWVQDKIDPPGRWGCNRWRDLPAGSFREAGTMVNTVILAVRLRS